MTTPPAPPTSDSKRIAVDTDVVSARIAQLRAEHDATDDAETQALLLYEVGVLEESVGDEAGAARDLLSAINVDPEFREPLERLIVIIERRKSFKNLGKLLDRLAKVAGDAAERSRALFQRALFLEDQENDPEAARAALEEAVAEHPDDWAAWLALEIVAAEVGDSVLRARALEHRAGAPGDDEWTARLRIDLARLQLEAGDHEGAIASLQSAIDAKGKATFLALGVLHRVGLEAGLPNVVARALEARAALILKAAENIETGDALGVPRFVRERACAADAWLQAAEAHRRSGDGRSVTALLEKLVEQLPDEPVLLQLRLRAAETAGDAAAVAQLARRQIELGIHGGVAASAWLRIAEAAAAEGDGGAALEALEKALAEDSDCIPARALQLDLLSAGASPQRLASALEAVADTFSEDDAKARYYLLATDHWARAAGDSQGAKAALSQAGMFGAPPNTVARVGRLLAAITGDTAWYEESTRRLLAAGAEDAEQPSLWFELGRLRLLRGDVEAAREAYDRLGKAPGGSWLSEALRAYVLELEPPAADDPNGGSSEGAGGAGTAALAALAEAEPDPAVARALRVVMSHRDLLAERAESAIKTLEDLHRADPSDPIVTMELACTLRAHGEALRAAEVLAACAADADDDELAASLQLEAGMLLWRGGAREAAVDSFSAAQERSPRASAGLLGWALRAAAPDSLDSRRRALDSIESEDSRASSLSLERFALEVGDDGDPHAAREAIEAIGGDAPPALKTAATLARALWAAPGSDPEARQEALATLESYGQAGRSIARASAHLERLAEVEDGTASPDSLEATGALWSAGDQSLTAAFEWLAGAMRTGSIAAELPARRALAERTGGGAGAALDASWRIIAALEGSTTVELGAGDTPEARLANLELAQPGCDPKRRAAALAGAADSVGEAELGPVHVARGWNLMATGNAASALECFRRAVELHPEEVIGWDGIRAAAEATGDRAAVAEACAALGDAVGDDRRGAELWEAAAFILLDELDDSPRGEFALGRAVERDIRRFDAFDRLFRMVRKRGDGERLLELIEKRLDVVDDPEQIAKLFWERARVLREAGDREGAMTALENVTMLEPDHVGALALSGEIAITLGKFPEAAATLARLAALEQAPNKQRLMSGVAAVDIYEKKLGDTESSLRVLKTLHEQGLSTQPVRERLARTAAKAGDWESATTALEQLMAERDSSEGRAEAARLAMVIYRDEIHAPERSIEVVRKLLEELPGDGEALDLALSGAFPGEATQSLLVRGCEATVAALQEDPLDAERINRLARMAAHLQDLRLRQAALGALVAVGHGTPAIDDELRTLDMRVARTPQMAIDERALPDLCHPEDRGPVPDMMRALAPTFAEILGPGLDAYGVSKRDRVKPSAGLPVRNEIAAWAGALGIGEFDLYVGGRAPEGIFGIPTSPPTMVVGSDVEAPLTPDRRQLMARELFALKRGSTILRHRDPTDIAALVIASCKVGGFEIPSPAYAMLGDFERQLSKGISRRTRKLLPQLAQPVAESGQDPLAWVSFAIASLDRLAAIAAGDVSYVLSAVGGVPRGQVAASREAEERARRVLAFVLSPTYLAMREQLGMGVR